MRQQGMPEFEKIDCLEYIGGDAVQVMEVMSFRLTLTLVNSTVLIELPHLCVEG